MLTESPQAPPNNWGHRFPKVPTKIQEKEDPVAVSEEDEASSDAVSEEDEASSDAVSDSDGSECSVDSEYNQDVDSYISHRKEKAEAVVMAFLKQVEENKFGEFQWPPPANCPTFKLGFTSHYIDQLWFENEKHTGEKYDTAKKFLKQVRTSWGYDVDCIPPKWLRPLLFPINMDNERQMRIHGETVWKYAEFAIKRINAMAEVAIRKTFELVKIDKVVQTTTTMLLLTLTIKETDSDAEKAIRVAVSSPYGAGGPEILECNLIPALYSSSSSW